MKIYVASSFDNYERVRHVISVLKYAGHEITFDWTQYVDAGRDVDDEEKKRRGEAEIAGVDAADALVLIQPGGRGTHFEFGYFYSKNKSNVFILNEVGDDYPLAFYYLDGVKIFTNLIKLVCALKP